jgi:RNA polymerase-binding transcription factor DksA
LAAGHYGRCLGCAAVIAPARLQAMPMSDFCVACVDHGE